MATHTTSPQHNPPAAQEFAREPLSCANGDADDTVLSTRHPFIAFKETTPASGAWRVRIESRHATPAVLYPNAIRLQARAVSEQGKSSFTWTNTTVANSGDREKLKFRVHVNAGEPAAIEVFGRVAKSTPAANPAAVKFCWPVA